MPSRLRGVPVLNVVGIEKDRSEEAAIREENTCDIGQAGLWGAWRRGLCTMKMKLMNVRVVIRPPNHIFSPYAIRIIVRFLKMV